MDNITLKDLKEGDIISCSTFGIKLTGRILVEGRTKYLLQNTIDGAKPAKSIKEYGYRLSYALSSGAIANIKILNNTTELKGFADRKLRMLLREKNII